MPLVISRQYVTGNSPTTSTNSEQDTTTNGGHQHLNQLIVIP